MTTEIINNHNSRFSRGQLLFTAIFLIYSIASPGNLPGDTEIRWSVARQIVRKCSISIEPEFQTRNFAFGVDGQKYSLWGLGQSLLLAPFAATGFFIEKFLDVPDQSADLFVQFLASSVLFPLIGAAAVWAFYRLARLLDYSETVSIFTSLIFAACTMHLHYSVVPHEQSQIILLLITAFIFFVRDLKQPSFKNAYFMCTAMGAAMLFRMDSIIMILSVYLVAITAAVAAGKQGSRTMVFYKLICAGLTGVIPFVIIIFWYNYARFGNIFENGNRLVAERIMAGQSLFSSHPLPTIAAMLFSPGKSIFLYNPVLLLVPFGVYAFFRKNKAIAIAAYTTITANFIFYSFYTTWTGDYAWGLRFQSPLIFMFLLPVLAVIEKPLRSAVKYLIILIAAGSFLIQAASVVYNFNLEFLQNRNHCLIPDGYVWDWRQSHLTMRFENIFRHIIGMRDFAPTPVLDPEPRLLKSNVTEQDVRDSYYVNIYPFKARSMMHPGSASLRDFVILLLLWLFELAAFSFLAVKLFKTVRPFSILSMNQIKQR